jgi:hypothetical protein
VNLAGESPRLQERHRICPYGFGVAAARRIYGGPSGRTACASGPCSANIGTRCGRDAVTQSVTATSISASGALLSGLSPRIRSGDLLWVEYQQRKARFRIVWVRDSQSNLKIQAAVQRLATEQCPWPALYRALSERTGRKEVGIFLPTFHPVSTSLYRRNYRRETHVRFRKQE